MSRTPFDSFSKQALETLLAPLGVVTTNREVAGESQYVDIYFVPTPGLDEPVQGLGLLEQMATVSCLIEPFRNPVKANEIHSCLLKLLLLQAEELRRSRREDPMGPQNPLLHLWILTPSLSRAVIASFGAQPTANRISGLYQLPAALQATIVVIHQLPRTAETLWLQLLGRGKVQVQAIAEVLSFPVDDPVRTKTLQLLASWKITLELGTVETQERELMMALSQAYLEWKQRTIEQGLQQGLEQGKQEGERSLILKLLDRKLGMIPPDIRSQVEVLSVSQLEVLGEALLEFSAIADLANWLQTCQSWDE
jgi:hypothetical protein